MIMDERSEFCDATSVGTPNGATLLLGDVMDLTDARDIGQGQTVYLVIQVTTTIGSGGSSTVSFQLASDVLAAIPVDGTQTVHATTDVYAVADLVAGWQFVMPLPMGDGNAADTTGYERYLGFQIVENASVALNAGNVNAFLTLDPAGWKSYPDAVN